LRTRTVLGRQPKIAVVSGESEYADEFLAFPFDKKIKFTAADTLLTSVLGEHTPMNVAAVLTVARELGVEEAVLKQTAPNLKGVPGRIEFIPEAQAHGFRVVVDYAFEPVALAALYKVVTQMQPKRVIHVLGSCGGGRDAAVRPVKGQFAAERAEIVIVTNEDPYDDEPMEIIADVAKGAEECRMKNPEPEQARYGAGVKCKMKKLFKILDRKAAIEKALALAQKDDLVLITGKGSEQAICVARGKKIPWDDRQVVRELLRTL
jgi:UDP-N-acetylmuramyl tripeptide synthase